MIYRPAGFHGHSKAAIRMTVNIQIASRDALAVIKEDLARFELGPDLRDSMSQHYEHLEALSASLRKLGLENATIDKHVVEIFEKYKAALLLNIERL